MASPVPAKSQPLHNFNLPEQLKWNTDSDHHRRRSIQSPARRPNPMPPSPLPHSPMLDFVSETPPRRYSPVYSLKPSAVRGESVRGDSCSSKMRELPIGEELGRARDCEPLEEEACEKSKGTPIIEYRRNNHQSKNSSSSYRQSKHSSTSYHHSKNSSDSHHHHSKNSSDSYHHSRNYSPSSDRNLRGSGFDFNHAGEGAAEKIERKPRVAPEDDAAGAQKSLKKILIKFPCKNKKPEEPNQPEETPSQKNKRDETNAVEEARVKHRHRHDVDNHKEHSPCRKIKLGLTKEEPFCKNNKLEQPDQKEPFTKNKEATLKEEFILKKNKKEEVAVAFRKEEFVMPPKKRKHVEVNGEEETPLKTIRQEVVKRKEESSSKKNKPDVATQKEEPFDKKNKHEVAHRKEEPFDKKNKQEVAHRKNEPFCKRNKLEETNGKEDKRKIEGIDVDAGKDVVVQEDDKIGSTNNVIDDDAKIWNLRPRRPFRNSLNVGGSGFVGSSKGETSIQSPSRNLNKKSGDNEENGSGVGEKKEKVKLSINVALTKREIEEDIFAFTGMKPSRRPQKRPKHVQKAIDAVCPGMWLVGITPDTYKVSERSMKG